MLFCDLIPIFILNKYEFHIVLFPIFSVIFIQEQQKQQQTTWAVPKLNVKHDHERI